MSLITDRQAPADVPEANPELVDSDTGLSIDAYLGFGNTPKAMTNPPAEGDVVTYLVKAECIGETKKRRTDGEMRYVRHMNIISAWKPGEPEPVLEQKVTPTVDENQPGLYDHGDEPADDEPEIAGYDGPR